MEPVEGTLQHAVSTRKDLRCRHLSDSLADCSSSSSCTKQHCRAARSRERKLAGPLLTRTTNYTFNSSTKPSVNELKRTGVTERTRTLPSPWFVISLPTFLTLRNKQSLSHHLDRQLALPVFVNVLCISRGARMRVLTYSFAPLSRRVGLKKLGIAPKVAVA